MQIRLIYILIVLIIIQSCSKSDSGFDSLRQLKCLEIDRSGNIQSWKLIYEKANLAFKNDILISISKTKNDSLVPFLEEILKLESNEGIINRAIFALGQTGTKEAERILISYFKRISSFKIQAEIIKAFEQCGSILSVPLLNEALSSNSLRENALQCAAILARKKQNVDLIKQAVTDSNWVYSDTKENAYFVFNSVEENDLGLIIKNLSVTKGITQKYYLKALGKILEQNKNALSDSLLLQIANESLKDILTGKEPWQNKLHALISFPSIADSSDHALIRGFTTSSNINLRVQGFNTYSLAFPNKSKAYLLNSLNNEIDYFVKGKLISLIAKNSPKTGYRLIQKNLDKGTISFKEELLNALDFYDNSFAKNTLKGFLLVQEKRLVNLAFSVLNKKNYLSLEDINGLMSTDHFSVLYNILDWQKTKKKYVEINLLLDAFVKFNHPDHFETQELILEIIKAKKEKLDSSQLEDLFLNLSTEAIYIKFKEDYPNSNKKSRAFESYVPDYLSVDSIMTLPFENILVEISTNKGEIAVELYPKIAPLTVKNFVELANRGFYDKLIFHRVIADFVIQGGDPVGDGWGGAGYFVQSEDFLNFERGTIGIATSGFDTGSCQFFICQSEQPHLRGSYTAFGKVVKGLDIVDNIQVDDIILSIKPISIN